ncbi:MAG: hypothetical protein K2Y02_03525 [Burkholderiaceae bacterium]|nr:hypothetical protein [Burkholderiaceae bacterium]
MKKSTSGIKPKGVRELKRTLDSAEIALPTAVSITQLNRAAPTFKSLVRSLSCATGEQRIELQINIQYLIDSFVLAGAGVPLDLHRTAALARLCSSQFCSALAVLGARPSTSKVEAQNYVFLALKVLSPHYIAVLARIFGSPPSYFCVLAVAYRHRVEFVSALDCIARSVAADVVLPWMFQVFEAVHEEVGAIDPSRLEVAEAIAGRPQKCSVCPPSAAPAAEMAPNRDDVARQLQSAQVELSRPSVAGPPPDGDIATMPVQAASDAVFPSEQVRGDDGPLDGPSIRIRNVGRASLRLSQATDSIALAGQLRIDLFVGDPLCDRTVGDVPYLLDLREKEQNGMLRFLQGSIRLLKIVRHDRRCFLEFQRTRFGSRVRCYGDASGTIDVYLRDIDCQAISQFIVTHGCR